MITQLTNKVRTVQQHGLCHPTTPVDEVVIIAEPMRADVLGKFKWWTPGAVYVNAQLLSLGPMWMAATVVHELRHHWQLHNTRVLYFAGLMYRPLIEKSAVEVERDAEKLLGIGGLSCGRRR